MDLSSHPQIYEKIGSGYRNRRVPDNRIAAKIGAALDGCRTVCNVGAGAGSYEPTDRIVIAVEPSQMMIQQRESTAEIVCASAEHLPFSDNHFDATMAILTVHHWQDPRQGLAEMRRISRRQIVFTFDTERQGDLWLVRDYIPEIIEFEHRRGIPYQMIVDAMKPTRIENIPIPWDCTDGFQAAYWRRPQAYLEPDVQATISTLAQLSADIVLTAMARLSDDLDSGEWSRKNLALATLDEKDFGYRLIVSEQ